jgi:ribokinase
MRRYSARVPASHRRLDASSRPGRRAGLPSALVLGDLALDVALAPSAPLARGTDVPGRVMLRQGGSAAGTARWLARLGVRSTLICSVGRDAPGRALVAAMRDEGVVVRAARPAGSRTARVGMLVDSASAERSFVADRGAADLLAPSDLRAEWFDHADVLHLPGYSLLGSPLGEAAAAAIEMARAAGVRVSLDLASAGPLLAGGRRAAVRLILGCSPDLLFANHHEAVAFLGESDLERLLRFAPVVVVKRGGAGATVLVRGVATMPTVRFDVATRPLAIADSTGAGDAFDAGVLAAWLSAPADEAGRPAALRRAVAAGHRVAARQLSTVRPELVF